MRNVVEYLVHIFYNYLEKEAFTMAQTKNERFKRIASARTNKILEQIRLLGNCSNKNNYAYTDEDVKKIFSAIDSELKATKARFAGSKEKGKFEL